MKQKEKTKKKKRRRRTGIENTLQARHPRRSFNARIPTHNLIPKSGL